MADADTEQAKLSGGRGASYPFVSLPEAIEHARTFFNAEGKNAAPVAAAIEHWGYGAKSSGGRQTVAALLQYGLMRDEGSAEQRRIALTKLGLDILLAENDSPAKRQAVAQAGRNPKLFKDVLARFPDGLPSDTTLRHYLIADRDIATAAVKGVIKNLRDTVNFASLAGSGTLPSPAPTPAEKPPKANPKVGDAVQWESASVLQFDRPRRVRAISQHEGADWVFVEGSATGIPMKEVTVATTAEQFKPSGSPPTLPEDRTQAGEREWIRGPLSKDISYRIMVSGDLGPKEITKLIRLLEAQRLVLSEDEEEGKN